MGKSRIETLTLQRVKIAEDAVGIHGDPHEHAGCSGVVLGKTIGGRQWRVLLDNGFTVSAGAHILILLGVKLPRRPTAPVPMTNRTPPPRTNRTPVPRKKPASVAKPRRKTAKLQPLNTTKTWSAGAIKLRDNVELDKPTRLMPDFTTPWKPKAAPIRAGADDFRKCPSIVSGRAVEYQQAGDEQ